MNLSEPFVRRPVATILIAIAIALAGMLAFKLLPVAPLPEVDFPSINVTAQLPGADPTTMSSSVAPSSIARSASNTFTAVRWPPCGKPITVLACTGLPASNFAANRTA